MRAASCVRGVVAPSLEAEADGIIRRKIRILPVLVECTVDHGIAEMHGCAGAIKVALHRLPWLRCGSGLLFRLQMCVFREALIQPSFRTASEGVHVFGLDAVLELGICEIPEVLVTPDPVIERDLPIGQVVDASVIEHSRGRLRWRRIGGEELARVVEVDQDVVRRPLCVGCRRLRVIRVDGVRHRVVVRWSYGIVLCVPPKVESESDGRRERNRHEQDRAEEDKADERGRDGGTGGGQGAPFRSAGVPDEERG